MAIARSPIPFNEDLRVSVVPDLPDALHSLTSRHGTCEFTVINPRDQREHIVQVQVESFNKHFETDGATFYNWLDSFDLGGKVVKVDGVDWGPPHNRFEARYHAGAGYKFFKFIRH